MEESAVKQIVTFKNGDKKEYYRDGWFKGSELILKDKPPYDVEQVEYVETIIDYFCQDKNE